MSEHCDHGRGATKLPFTSANKPPEGNHNRCSFRMQFKYYDFNALASCGMFYKSVGRGLQGLHGRLRCFGFPCDNMSQSQPNRDLSHSPTSLTPLSQGGGPGPSLWKSLKM